MMEATRGQGWVMGVAHHEVPDAAVEDDVVVVPRPAQGHEVLARLWGVVAMQLLHAKGREGGGIWEKGRVI